LLTQKGIPVKALIRSQEEAEKVAPYTDDVWIGDASQGESEIQNLTEGISIVISARGKSVSLFSRVMTSFLKQITWQTRQSLMML